MEHTNLIKATLVSEQEIRQRVAQLGKQITADYKGKRPIVIGILKGAWVYLADLLREVDVDVEVDFMSVSSYGSGTSTSGTITIVKDLTVDVTGRDVLIVEDIVDSGKTLRSLKASLLERGAKSVKTVTLLDKPSARKVSFEVDYKVFDVGAGFVVGYGMDYAEQYRNLPYIALLKPAMYGG